jgi:FlaA1/EpsC-like NDP-sugar epimerase
MIIPRHALPHWCVFLADCFIVVASSLFVHAMMNGAVHTLGEFWPLMGAVAVMLVCYIVGFRIFHTYSGIIRYSSFVDLRRVGYAMLTGLALIILLRYLIHCGTFCLTLRLRELILTFFLATALLWALRVVIKYLFDASFSRLAAENVFIYGVKNGGYSLSKNIFNQTPVRYILRGFVSDADDLASKTVMGVRVYPNDTHLVDEMQQKHATILMVSPLKSGALRRNEAMVNALIDAHIKIMMVQTTEWNGNSDAVPMPQLRDVQVEDLLPRDEIKIDLTAVAEQLRGRVILITGSAGSIGSEIVRQVAKFHPSQMILIDQAETPQHDIRLMMAQRFPDVPALTIVTSICNARRMESIFAKYRPDYVFHAAAYKHVPMMEDNPCESIHNNVHGTRIVADLAVKYGTKKFVMISTDKAVNPTNVMGCSKRICEIYVQSLDHALKEGKLSGNTQFVTTRFGNVLGSNGSVIPLFKEQIKQGGPLTVTDPRVIRFFMLIPEACQLVLEAGTRGQGGEIFVFDMGKPVKIDDLAHRMIRLSGAPHIKIVYTGLRDGEKLYEEVLNTAESTLPTFNPKIRIATVRQYDYAQVCSELDELYDISLCGDDMRVVQYMKMIVPEYVSKHSKYETIDEEMGNV